MSKVSVEQRRSKAESIRIKNDRTARKKSGKAAKKAGSGVKGVKNKK